MVLLKSLEHKALLARQLALSDWLVLAKAWWLLFFFHTALRWISYERLMTSANRIAGSSIEPPHILIFAQRLHRLVGFASRLHLIPMTCLIRSLTLQQMLIRRNIPAQVRIGVQKVQDAMYAHAWVEVNGEPVGEVDDVRHKFIILASTIEINNQQFI